MSEINVTPFVDVMLVLLIIFMVAAPMLTVGVDVELPKSAANALESENEEPLTISITKEGEIVLQTSTIPKEELVTRLKVLRMNGQVIVYFCELTEKFHTNLLCR